MRFLVVPLAFSLACGHATVVSPSPTPGPTPAPPPAAPPAPDPCTPDPGPAASVLRAFRAELLAAAEGNAHLFQASIRDRMVAFREKNRAVLAAHAVFHFKRIPKGTIPGLEAMPDDPRVPGAVAERIQAILTDAPSGDGLSLQGILELLAVDPLRAFAGIRGIVMAAVGSPGDLARMRENVLEGLAPPRVVRLNDDADHPLLAMPRRADTFVVGFDRDAQRGIYVPRTIRWVRRDPPLQPTPDATTVEEVFQSFATAVESSPPGEGLTTANLAERALAQVGELGKQWLDPHAARLRAHATCLCKQLPVAPLPDYSDWIEEEGRWNLVFQTGMFPRLRWDPGQAFLFLRTSVDSRTMAVGDYAGIAFVDSLVPPTVYRVGDDLNDPTLFLVEGKSALVVVFSASPERGYFPTQVRYFRRR